MTHVGIDIEQFVTDPYASGIQRVLQYLAKEWPQDIGATFIAPHRDEYLLLTPEQAGNLVSLAFDTGVHDNLSATVAVRLEELAEVSPRVREGSLLALFSSWLLPEVSYLPRVLGRFELFGRSMPTTMIGFDALPMTEPANYRFIPGTAHDVNTYFRLLTQADSVVCISEYSRNEVWNRLRRSRTLPIHIAHPGGDHIPALPRNRGEGRSTGTRFIRLGTLEARKRPLDILNAFRGVRALGTPAELVFIGNPSASDPETNAAIHRASQDGIGVQWLTDLSDSEVHAEVAKSDVFLSIGTEGYGIPVLESIRLGTPVAFAGIQPAAELMVGKGAVRIEADDVASLTTALHHLATNERDAESKVNPNAVPTWKDFAHSVAAAST